ncbi:hypothetical protein [Streptomyces sp. NPDC053427]|uniref:hypothetical protein n=1 Tax=Streptomyces sp. NPDC053427 TaxID=3365701 RepID=UPI0037D11710
MECDDLLVGHWSSLPFSYGVMELSELGFLGDGRGWSVLLDVGAMWVTRFTWRCPEAGVVELHAQWMVQGTPGQDVGPSLFSSSKPPERVDEVTRHRYGIGPAVPMPGAEALTTVTFEEPVEFCHEFARGSTQIRPADDPTSGQTMPPWGVRP